MVRKIVGALDLSRAGEAPVRYAEDVARWLDADLGLVYAAQDCRTQRGVSLLAGPTPHAIVSYSDNANADVILMPLRSAGEWSRLFRPSIIEQVLRTTDKPVWLVSDPTSGFRVESHQILCVLSLDGSDSALISTAEAIANQTSSELILSYGIPADGEGALAFGLLSVDQPLSARVALLRIKELGEYLTVPYTTRVRAGTPGAWLRETVRQLRPDLIVTGRHLPESPRTVARQTGSPVLSVSKAAVVEQAMKAIRKAASNRAESDVAHSPGL